MVNIHSGNFTGDNIIKLGDKLLSLQETFVRFITGSHNSYNLYTYWVPLCLTWPLLKTCNSLLLVVNTSMYKVFMSMPSFLFSKIFVATLFPLSKTFVKDITAFRRNHRRCFCLYSWLRDCCSEGYVPWRERNVNKQFKHSLFLFFSVANEFWSLRWMKAKALFRWLLHGG